MDLSLVGFVMVFMFRDDHLSEGARLFLFPSTIWRKLMLGFYAAARNNSSFAVIDLLDLRSSPTDSQLRFVALSNLGHPHQK